MNNDDKKPKVAEEQLKEANEALTPEAKQQIGTEPLFYVRESNDN